MFFFKTNKMVITRIYKKTSYNHITSILMIIMVSAFDSHRFIKAIGLSMSLNDNSEVLFV